jgi:hypothetical protein
MSKSPARLHEIFVAGGNRKPAATPEVCPKLSGSPSAWAESALHFQAEPKQAEVLNHHAHRLILCCPRQWGKSTIVAIKALHFALNNPKSEILVLSNSEDHAGIVVEKIAAYAAALEIPRRRAHGKRYSLELPNHSRIFAVAHNHSSGVGYTADIVIVDEAALVDDQVLSYVSRVLTRTNGRLWLIGTPRGQTGLFYSIWHDKSLNWHRVKATIDDAPYAGAAFIAEQKSLFPGSFRQDFYCEFVQSPGRLLSRDRIAKNIDPALNCRLLPDDDQKENYDTAVLRQTSMAPRSRPRPTA